MDDALVKYTKNSYRVDKLIVSAICTHIYTDWKNKEIEPGLARLFNFDESVIGIAGEAFCDGIPRGTSAGYPYVTRLPSGTKGKQAWFGSGVDYDLTSKECDDLRKDVDALEYQLTVGELPFVPAIASLKDETRPLKKVAQLQTRVVFCLGIDFLIVMRMYFMGFSVWVMRNRIDNGSAVGINPFSDEWTMLAEHLQSKGPRVFAGDHKNFDANYYEDMLLAVVDEIVQPYYNDGAVNHNIRRTIMMTIAQGHVIYRSAVMKLLNSWLSGLFGTAIFQSIKNLILIRHCYYHAMGCSPNAIIDFDEHVSVTVFGDDHVVNVSEQRIGIFNQHSMKMSMMYLYNSEYTSDVKTDLNPPPSRLLREVTFLKRGFCYDSFSRMYLAPLDLDTIMEMPYWTKNGILFDQITLDNARTAIRELALHPDSVYYLSAQTIQEATDRVLKYRTYVPSRRVLLGIIMGSNKVYLSLEDPDDYTVEIPAIAGQLDVVPQGCTKKSRMVRRGVMNHSDSLTELCGLKVSTECEIFRTGSVSPIEKDYFYLFLYKHDNQYIQSDRAVFRHCYLRNTMLVSRNIDHGFN
jgi:hypothetical protein